MSYSIKSEVASTNNYMRNAANLTVRLMLEGAHAISLPNTPMREGTLRTQVLKTMDRDCSGTIAWLVPYAKYQERGSRKNKEPWHYTTPGTGPHFARNAIKEVSKNIGQYARQGGLIV